MDQSSMKSTPIEAKTKFLSYYERYMLVIGILGQLLFYTQGIKIFITKSAGDVSIVGFSLGLLSGMSWLFYGILLKNSILIYANTFAVIGALFVILGIWLHGS